MKCKSIQTTDFQKKESLYCVRESIIFLLKGEWLLHSIFLRLYRFQLTAIQKCLHSKLLFEGFGPLIETILFIRRILAFL